MARHKKRQFHCQKCGNPCDTYKKGKAHRVLVCPECGVIATNPRVLKSVLKRAGRAVLGEIPGASLAMEGLGLIKDIKKKDRSETSKEGISVHPPKRLGEFEKALLIEMAERR